MTFGSRRVISSLSSLYIVASVSRLLLTWSSISLEVFELSIDDDVTTGSCFEMRCSG